MSFLSDNDDDLFDYEPSEDPVADAPVTSFRSNTDPAAHSSDDQRFIDDLKNSVTAHHDDDLDPIQGFINRGLSNFYSAFQDAIDTFVNKTGGDALYKSMHLMLDELTQGRFTLMQMFYHYEMRIARKIVLSNLFRNFFAQDQDEISPMLVELSGLLDIQISDQFYDASFKTTNNIFIHSLTMDLVMYRYLATKTGLPLQAAFCGDLNMQHNPDLEPVLRTMTITHFRDDLHHRVLEAFFAPDDVVSTSLSHMISEAFSVDATYVNQYPSTS